MHFGEIVTKDRSARQEIPGRVMDSSLRVVAIGKEVSESLAMAKPVAIETRRRPAHQGRKPVRQTSELSWRSRKGK